MGQLPSSHADLKEKIAIVTGGNAGIGYFTSLELARDGARVFIAGRDETRCNQAIEKIKAAIPDAKVEFLLLDLNSLQSVRDCVENFKSKDLPLHLLVNNAGIMALPNREVSADGFEKQMAVNHLGHFLLTNLLLDVIKDSAPARIINVSSRAHRSANLNLDDINLEKRYSPWTAYGNTKLASNIFFGIISKTSSSRMNSIDDWKALESLRILFIPV
eukprot:TRINITY_DN3541_c0_g1_i2.p1 TRINITY_DN3541_c0_g1~~TRINITY_DN3541_c0_g1_i2.p1  ORF type:complete len:217 (-),score=54.58 TRINITY_DN3541_c0_g1_i2:607-1257(-)